MNRIKVLALLNGLFFIIAFLTSNLSRLKVFSYQDIGQVSDKYDTVFAPAGLTFSIWGVIYIALFGFVGYHILQAFKKDPTAEANQVTGRMGWLFIINNIAATAWVLAWLNEWLLISCLLMLVQLFTLLQINIRAGIYNPDGALTCKVFTQFPLSIYFAWICVATIANFSASLSSTPWQGWGISASYWTIILIGLASLLSIFIVLIRRNVFFGLVVIWAFYGIIIKRTAVNELLYHDVILAARAGIVFVALAAAIQLYLFRQKKRIKRL